MIEEDEHSTELSVTQAVDIRDCRQRAEINTGMALAIENELSKQVSLQLAVSGRLNTDVFMSMILKYNTFVNICRTLSNPVLNGTLVS